MKRKINLIIKGIIAFFLIVATVTALGGTPFREWFGPSDISRTFFAFLDSVTLSGGFIFTFVMVALLCILFFIKSKLEEEESEPSENNSKIPDKIDTSGVPLKKLKVGSISERVGRDEAIQWLEEQLLDSPTDSVAVCSVHGAGGMGKTFLAHLFAATHRESRDFIEIFVGDRPALDAGIEFLGERGFDTSGIKSPETLKELLTKALYSESCGILIIDDVWRDDIDCLKPDTINWRVLITTRDKKLGKKHSSQIYQLDELEESESLELFQKVLGNLFNAAEKEEYVKLARFLANRPYGVRLAAEALNAPLGSAGPAELLEALKNDAAKTPAEAEDPYSMGNLTFMLEHSLKTLEERSPLAREFLNYLAACRESGMELAFFLKWQAGEEISAPQVENELTLAQDLGLLLIDERESRTRRWKTGKGTPPPYGPSAPP